MARVYVQKLYTWLSNAELRISIAFVWRAVEHPWQYFPLELATAALPSSQSLMHCLFRHTGFGTIAKLLSVSLNYRKIVIPAQAVTFRSSKGCPANSKRFM
jgi:hypothetical protein